jgi:hypothetical protein
VAKSIDENPFRDMEFASGGETVSRSRPGDSAEKPRSDSAQNRARSKAKDKGKEKARDRSDRNTRGSSRGNGRAGAAAEKVAKDTSDSDRRGRRPPAKAPSPPWLLPALGGALVLSVIMAIAGIYLIGKRLNAPDTPKQAPAAPAVRRPSKDEEDLPSFKTNVPDFKPKDGGAAGS